MEPVVRQNSALRSRILSFSPRSPVGEFRSAAAACCFETETFPDCAATTSADIFGCKLGIAVQLCDDAQQYVPACDIAEFDKDGPAVLTDDVKGPTVAMHEFISAHMPNRVVW